MDSLYAIPAIDRRDRAPSDIATDQVLTNGACRSICIEGGLVICKSARHRYIVSKAAAKPHEPRWSIPLGGIDTQGGSRVECILGIVFMVMWILYCVWTGREL